MGWRRRRALVAEVRGHLEDAAAEARERGVEPQEAERQAVARFGDPVEMAAALRPPRPVRWWLVGAVTSVLLGATLVAVVGRASDSSAWPTVIGVRQFASNHAFDPIVAVTNPNPLQLSYAQFAKLVPAGCLPLREAVRARGTWSSPSSCSATAPSEATGPARCHPP